MIKQPKRTLKEKSNFKRQIKNTRTKQISRLVKLQAKNSRNK